MTAHRSTVEPCRVHVRHHPRPSETDRHHVWPVGLGGPERPADPAGLVTICPTGHVNVHRRLRELLTAWLAGQLATPARHLDAAESALAASGYAAVLAHWLSLEGVDADQYRGHVARFLSEHIPGTPT